MKKIITAIITAIIAASAGCSDTTGFRSGTESSAAAEQIITGGEIEINGGDPFTSEEIVSVSLNVKGAEDFCFSTDGASWSEWEPFVSQKHVALDYGFGEKNIYFRFRGAHGSAIELSDDIFFIEQIIPAGLSAGDMFGSSAAISADGNIICAGAPGHDGINDGLHEDQGAAYVCSFSGGWSVRRLEPAAEKSGDRFGTSISISWDGAIIAAGAPGSNSSAGSISIFERISPEQFQLSPASTLSPPAGGQNSRFGETVHLSSDGTTLIAGAPGYGGTGAVFVYRRTSSGWMQAARLTAPDMNPGALFGRGTASSANGDIIYCGAPGRNSGLYVFSGSIYMFVRNGASWIMSGIFTPQLHDFSFAGESITASADGTLFIASARGTPFVNSERAGAAYLYSADRPFTPTIVRAENPSSFSYFGSGASISSDGTAAAAGSPGFSSGNISHGALNTYSVSNRTLLIPRNNYYPADPENSMLYGYTSRLSSDGKIIAAGSPGTNNSSGAVFIIREN